jgi:hypothetical protein
MTYSVTGCSRPNVLIYKMSFPHQNFLGAVYGGKGVDEFMSPLNIFRHCLVISR